MYFTITGNCPIGLLQILSLCDSPKPRPTSFRGPPILWSLKRTGLGPGLSRPTTRSARAAQWCSHHPGTLSSKPRVRQSGPDSGPGQVFKTSHLQALTDLHELVVEAATTALAALVSLSLLPSDAALRAAQVLPHTLPHTLSHLPHTLSLSLTLSLTSLTLLISLVLTSPTLSHTLSHTFLTLSLSPLLPPSHTLTHGGDDCLGGAGLALTSPL
jgi:hypothetical protein